jgi:hypothetical protein
MACRTVLSKEGHYTPSLPKFKENFATTRREKPSPRRRFQFSLRLALLLMTLACVVASWIGWVLVKYRYDIQDGLIESRPHQHLDDQGRSFNEPP